jgi:hypothetical protein
VLIILIDDVGFGASGAFGGPCNTPNLERLAANGLKYNRFHTTALCSPTRSALLTGCNHHSSHSSPTMHRGHARAAPRSAPVVGQVPGPVRPGLGQAARGDVRATEGARRHSGRLRPDRTQSRDSRLGRHHPGDEARPGTADGDLRRGRPGRDRHAVRRRSHQRQRTRRSHRGIPVLRRRDVRCGQRVRLTGDQRVRRREVQRRAQLGRARARAGRPQITRSSRRTGSRWDGIQ